MAEVACFPMAFNTSALFSPDFSRKRGREDDQAEEDTPSHKRLHSTPLPFRSSPTVKHIRGFSHSKRNAPRPLFTQVLTPTDSEEEISPPFGPVDPFQSKSNAQASDQEVQLSLPQYTDAMMDLSSPKCPTPHELDAMMLSPQASPCSIIPPTANNTPNTPHKSVLGAIEHNNARIPTPIYGHFQRLDTSDAIIQPDSVTSSPADKTPHDKASRVLRLPTPISEDEAMDTFDEEADTVIPEIDPAQLRQPSRLAQPLPPQSPKRTKPMFSMGFRADCEMCRTRMPGHYNHIFRA